MEGAALVVLAGTNRALTGREVARLTGRTAHSGVLGALNRLTEHGLVEREEAGRAHLFSLNRDHLAAPAVALLAGLRPELWRRLRESISEWSRPPEHVSVFGSAARGDGSTRSDIDIFIVRPDRVEADDEEWTAQIDDLASRIRRWTGNRASVAQVTLRDLAELKEKRARVLRDLERDAITIAGAPARDLLAEL